MRTLTLGRLTVDTVVERAGPTRPTWLLPDATPDAVARHRAWLVPLGTHFHDPTAGRIVRHGDAWRFEVL